MAQSSDIELSVVMPCLNEADTLEECINAAKAGIAESGAVGEIVIADNGSSDGSQNIAARCGVRVEAVAQRGYGAALMGGIAAARGRFVLMADADRSYDFRQIPRFVERLRDGYELVQGCRLPSGGGSILKGAMPFLHQYLGNPVFSWLARWWFGTPIHDIHCGMRAFSTDFHRGLKQSCTGMEFASEMIIKATFEKAKIAEVPITLHPDGRVSHPPHLRTWRDGWRHLRFFLLFSPRWLFFIPGLALILLGCFGFAIAMPGMTLGQVRFDVHTLVFSSLFVLVGYESILFSVFTKIFAITEGLLPADPRLERLFKVLNLEKGLVVGAVSAAIGIGLLLAAVNQWRVAGFGDLQYTQTMRWVIPGATFTALGAQTILSSFFLSVLGLARK
jgi:glycosyltransferase involved in cell wall biosynthesis